MSLGRALALGDADADAAGVAWQRRRRYPVGYIAKYKP
jgi:hypothetical protein